MGSAKRILDQMKFTQELPPELKTDIPIVELAGSSRVLIEHHRGIRGYSNCEICVLVKDGSISVSGNNLSLAKMSKEQLIITGKIEGIRLINRGGE